MSEVVLRAVLAAVAVRGQSRLPGLVKECTRYRLWLHTQKSREMAHRLDLSFLLPNPVACDCLQVAALPVWAILPNVVSLETQLLTWSTCRLVFLFWKSWRGPRWSPLSPLLRYLICASEPDSSYRKFFLYVFHQQVKGMRHILLSQNLPDVSQKGAKYNMRSSCHHALQLHRSFCPLLCVVFSTSLHNSTEHTLLFEV